MKVFASLVLLKSVGMAKYLNNLAGKPNVPEEMIRKIQKAPIKPKACLELAADFIHTGHMPRVLAEADPARCVTEAE